jgi:hypothetical protein
VQRCFPASSNSRPRPARSGTSIVPCTIFGVSLKFRLTNGMYSTGENTWGPGNLVHANLRIEMINNRLDQ